MSFVKRLLAFLALSALPVGALPQEAPLDESGKTGIIHVTVVNSFGYPLPGATITLEGVGLPRRVLLAGKSEALPYGRYTAVAELVNHGSSSVDIDLREPDAEGVIGLIPHALLGFQDRITVAGKLERGVDASCRLLRMVPLFTAGPAYDASVLHNHFAITGAMAGMYAVTVFGPTGVCRLSQVTVGFGARLQSVSVP